jgi:hypothetical protein
MEECLSRIVCTCFSRMSIGVYRGYDGVQDSLYMIRGYDGVQDSLYMIES